MKLHVVGAMSPPVSTESPESKRAHCTEFKYTHKDGKGAATGFRV